MRLLNTIHAAGLILALLAALLLSGTMQATAQKPRVTDLFAFAEKTGVSPVAVIEASDGCLYGTTASGGEKGLAGTVFKITPSGTLTTLYSFTGGSDGGSPAGSLIQARDGKLYGTTSQGGTNGLGTVFRITTAGRLTTLHSFNGNEGNYPDAGLVQTSNGSLYGVTAAGGASGVGTVFKITTTGTLTTLYSFSGNGDGTGPYSALIQASDGSLYGTTGAGGANGYGTLFEITTAGTLTNLYSFRGRDGASPDGGLIQATNGDLYGTMAGGGGGGYGTVFRFSGVYPVPVLIALSPASGNSGSPAFTLKVTGASFQTFSTVNWSGAPLTTTFVSPTQLTATVPASLIAAPGTAEITVVTPAGGGASKSKAFNILVTTLKLKTAKLTRDTSTNTLTAVVTLSNTGFLSASGTTLTQATLNGSAATNLPQSAGSIAAGSTATAPLVFPGSSGTSGQKVTLQVSGTFTGGTFSGSLKVTLP